MAILYNGTVSNKVDRKGRVSVPAAYRNNLAKQGLDGIAAYPAPDAQAVQGSGIDEIAKISARFSQTDPFSPEFADARMAIFPDIRELAFDGDGRVTLPDDLIAYAGLTDEATFVGLGDRFQIWEPKALKEARRTAKVRFAEKRPELPPAPGGSG